MLQCKTGPDFSLSADQHTWGVPTLHAIMITVLPLSSYQRSMLVNNNYCITFPLAAVMIRSINNARVCSLQSLMANAHAYPVPPMKIYFSLVDNFQRSRRLIHDVVQSFGISFWRVDFYRVCPRMHERIFRIIRLRLPSIELISPSSLWYHPVHTPSCHSV